MNAQPPDPGEDAEPIPDTCPNCGEPVTVAVPPDANLGEMNPEGGAWRICLIGHKSNVIPEYHVLHK
jgi:hypothetical protein